MRIALTADIQVDERSRFDETKRLLSWVVEDAFSRGVDAWVDCGDLFERKSTATERAVVHEFVEDVTAEVPMVIVRGNHDAIGEIEELNRLALGHDLMAVERPCVVPFDGFDVACLPWPSKSSLLAWAGDVSIEQSKEIAGDLLRDVLRGLNSQRRDGVPCLFAAHAMIRGARTSTGQPLVGCDMEIGSEDMLLVGADAYALGHVHRGQDFDIGAPAFYVGSLRRRDFGEVEDKRYAIVTLEPGRPAEVEFVKVPATPLHLIEARWESVQAIDGEWLQWFMDGLPQVPMNGEIRLRYEVDADQREAAARAAEGIRETLLSEGASHVKLEEQVRPTVRARAPEVAEAVGVADQLRAFWDATDPDLGEERRGRLLSLVSDLQEVGR